MIENIMVSVVCQTYNHENYIEDAIQSFLNQNTTFNIEIIIHDDASTDNTREIIRKYEAENKNLIKVIYQDENQYSKGINIRHKYINPLIRGKYVAICEGDDYWTDIYKLQKQVDYMEQHEECTFCFTNGIVVGENEKKNKLVIPWLAENKKFYKGINTKYTAGEIQLLGYIPTASMMFRSSLNEEIPKFVKEAIVGDNALKLHASSKGYAYYIDEVTCTYRFNVPESATTKWKTDTKEKHIERCDGFIRMLDDFNKYSEYKYDKDIELSKLTWEVQKIGLNESYEILKNKKYKNYFNLLDNKSRRMYYIKSNFPRMFKEVRKIYKTAKKRIEI